MRTGGVTAPSGELGLIMFPNRWPEAKGRNIIQHGFPNRQLPAAISDWRTRNFPNLWRGLWRAEAARKLGLSNLYGALYLDLLKADGQRIPLGLASMRVVTTAGVNFIVDAFQNSVELENMKFHAFGTGSNAEAVGNTALHTELTTEYAVNSTRPTGSTTEGASANIYRTVGTLSPDASCSITEHGIFDQAASGGTLLDKTLFTAVALVSGDSLQATYDLTFTAGS